MKSKIFKTAKLTNSDFNEIVYLLNSGKVGILPTDTIYGIHCLAFNKSSVEKIYELKNRPSAKAMIVIISSLNDLENFNTKLSEKMKKFLSNIWPNKVSVILDCSNPQLSYLYKKSYSLAFRVPNNSFLLKLLKKTGPLVSTSVNLSGLSPAQTIKQAQEYFPYGIDFYVDGGKIDSKPSTVIKLNNQGVVELVRKGAVTLDL